MFRQARNVVVTAWKDKRLVYVLKPNTTIKQPLNITSYNKYMGGVDKADQLRSYYQLRMKSRKFYM